jgi:hypothetical protein
VITWAGGAGIGCRATNNVVYGNVHCGLKEMGHGGTDIRMESFYGKPDARINPGRHEVLADPRFVDAARGDFRLRPDSPCLGRAGVDGPPLTTGMRDLGAFQRSMGSRSRARRSGSPLP